MRSGDSQPVRISFSTESACYEIPRGAERQQLRSDELQNRETAEIEENAWTHGLP